MNRKDVTPTQRYPKILWYQVKNTIPSEEQQRIILLNHTIRIDEFLKKRYPTASDEDIKEATDAQAKEDRKRVYFLNNHSDGYRYLWYYSTYRSALPNKSLYRFIPSRDNKRNLCKLIKDPTFKGDYYE